MIPEALQQNTALDISSTILAGIVIFFILEKMVIWRHCHTSGCEVHGAAGPLILIGDAFHNFVDGFVIAAAFLTSVPLGIAASLAVIAHEIPQEVGDFAILLENGYSRSRAFMLNLLSSLTTLPGAVIAYFYLGVTREAVPFILALSAASFIYIAIADLVPGLHRQVGLKPALIQLFLVIAGIGTIAIFRLAH
jgi:zinc and cadmium transporter